MHVRAEASVVVSSQLLCARYSLVERTQTKKAVQKARTRTRARFWKRTQLTASPWATKDIEAHNTTTTTKTTTTTTTTPPQEVPVSQRTCHGSVRTYVRTYVRREQGIVHTHTHTHKHAHARAHTHTPPIHALTEQVPTSAVHQHSETSLASSRPAPPKRCCRAPDQPLRCTSQSTRIHTPAASKTFPHDRGIFRVVPTREYTHATNGANDANDGYDHSLDPRLLNSHHIFFL